MTTYQPQPTRPQWLLWLIPSLLFTLIWWVLPVLLPTLPVDWLTSDKAAWYLTRASGTVGYLLLAGSTIWGLLLSTRLAKKIVPPAVSLAMHNTLSWTAIGATVFHAAVLLFDSYYVYTPADLLIPFLHPYSPLWVGLGIISFYIMLLTSLSFRWRNRIGQKNWRKLHYLTFVAYLFTTLHGWMAGTDSLQLANMFVGSSVIVLFLTAYRIITAAAKAK